MNKILIIDDGEKLRSQQMSAFSMAGAEKLHIQKVLNHTEGNKAEAARLLEIGIAKLYRKMELYKISYAKFDINYARKNNI